VRLDVSCLIRMECRYPTPLLLVLRPRSSIHQWIVRESYVLTPQVPASEYLDGFGNLCQRLVAPSGAFCIETRAEAIVASSADTGYGEPYVLVECLPDDALVYLLPSRFCESDRLGAVAMDASRGQRLGYDQVAAISRWVHARLRYLPESDPMPVSAAETLARGEGVCRDFAHLAIALCRSLSIPARIVVGYLQDLKPMDLHAWFEAFVGDRWYAFDPTRPQDNKARVILARGRDAADVPVFNLFGPPMMPTEMRISVQVLPD
jgi:transglutaminase-like putative cysteine protease